MRRILIGAVTCAALCAGLLLAQGPGAQPATSATITAETGPVPPGPAPAGEVVGVGNFIHVVANIDRSLAFYRDVLGFQMQQAGGRGGRGGAPAAAAPAPPPDPHAPRPFVTMPEVLRLYNSTADKYRNSAAFVPEFVMRAEMGEFEDADRQPIHPRFQDPGASYFILTVRDIDSIMARVKMSDPACVVTTGGEPVRITSDGVAMRAVVLRDPDSFYVVLSQPDPLPQSAAPPERNVIGMAFGFTVSSTEPMARLFKNALGFAPETEASFDSDKALGQLFGTPGAQVKRTRALVPGTSFYVVFNEFKGVDRKPVHSNAPKDPGSPVFRLRVRDIDSMLKTLGANGVTVASADGQTVTIGNANRFAITRGPDNLFIQVVGPAAPAAAPGQ